jgi:hypothetical protein
MRLRRRLRWRVAHDAAELVGRGREAGGVNFAVANEQLATNPVGDALPS